MTHNRIWKDRTTKAVAAAMVFILATVVLTSLWLPDKAHGDSYITPSIIEQDADPTTPENERAVRPGSKAYFEIVLIRKLCSGLLLLPLIQVVPSARWPPRNSTAWNI